MSESDITFNERDRRSAAVIRMLSTDPSYDNRIIASVLTKLMDKFLLVTSAYMCWITQGNLVYTFVSAYPTAPRKSVSFYSDVILRGSKWVYSCWFGGCCYSQDLFKTAHILFVLIPCRYFSKLFFKVLVVQPYTYWLSYSLQDFRFISSQKSRDI